LSYAVGTVAFAVIATMKELLKHELRRNSEYWHVTSRSAFDQILHDRELRAMPEERSAYRLRTAARYLNGVALFDLNSPEFEYADETGHHWDFFKTQPFAMAIGIDPKRLTGEVLAHPATRVRTDKSVTGQILQLPLLIEVIHIGPIPSTAWTRYLRINPDFSFEQMTC